MKKLNILTIILLIVGSSGFAQEQVLYKQIDSTELFMELYRPQKSDTAYKYPAMVFFFGGGWKGGSRYQFLNQAKYFSKRGLICFLVDYRIEEKHGTSPFESLKDAKSAIRYIRKNASELGVDPNKIIAAGGSAGGHLAVATALIQNYNEETDDLSVRCIPNALVLFNPVIDNGPGGYGHARIGDEYRRFSPIHNLKKETPPTIFLLGTKDDLVPVETAQYYEKVMKRVGSRCELKLYKGKEHGFFNYKNFSSYKRTVLHIDKFLKSLGYLNEEPRVRVE
ncbi:alpha/beta hydrolase [Seonamhaeicola sp.]|uniref:alpha/beta hydrolase n=1 Tax=Seonamhaeicola sp. TaxID=1912245 RepID=UPI00262D93C4|nr:alpha/beta hydrolase [Seonamhaeicola sp.]